MRSSIAALALLAVAGCKSEKLKAVETDLEAARLRVAALDKKRLELTAKSKQLQLTRKTYAQQADEAELARVRLNGATFVLSGGTIPDSLLLDEAMRAKSPELGTLAAKIVQRQLPCVDPDAPGEEPDGPDCSPPPLDDACEGVDERVYQPFAWSCPAVVTEQGPATAVCTSPVEMASSEYPLFTTTDKVNGVVVRLAFESKGRLVVGDWPTPKLDYYYPTNDDELATCRASNDSMQCVRACDEKFQRLPGGCDDWAGDGYDGEGGEESEEPAELREARRAAAEAELEAGRARDEVAYQECLVGCGDGEIDLENDPVADMSLEFKKAPAPGVFQFAAKVPKSDGGVSNRAVLLSFPAFFEAKAGTLELGDKDTVRDLSYEFETEHLIEGPVADGKRVYAGMTPEDTIAVMEVSLDGSEAPQWLGVDEGCAFAEKMKNKDLIRGCKAAQDERARIAAKVIDAGMPDAGVPDAGVPDAGTSDAGGAP